MVDDLVFDIGAHRGEDSSFYLAAGYRVVAVEAHPGLAAECRARFADHNSYELVEGAVSDSEAPTVRFFTHPVTLWGTTDRGWVNRNTVIADSTPIDVPTIDIGEVLDRHGVPRYMKVDIEGADTMCVEALRDFSDRPQFVSLESAKTSWSALVEEFSLLEELGYRRFAVMQQASIPGSVVHIETLARNPLTYTFEPNASGLFGDYITDWTDRQTAEERYRQIYRSYKRWGDGSPIGGTKMGRKVLGRIGRYTSPLPGWYDTHASRG